MDTRHVMILFNLLLLQPYNRVLEIGSHYGYSTTAFLEALNVGFISEVHLCDIHFMDSVKHMYQNTKFVNRFFLHEERSVNFLMNAPFFDFVLLDGSHIAEDVEDEFEYLSMNGTNSYLLHDTYTQLLPESHDTPWYDGPMFLMEKMQCSPDWFCLEDHLYRDGEQTERGICFATKNKKMYERATLIFEFWTRANIRNEFPYI
ncbi:MAG: class I SAM-dependent methyltransferase [Bacteroidales bacterium]|nr:class I SAM-dependent methyltransferase [Bacteroidales bacterium]